MVCKSDDYVTLIYNSDETVDLLKMEDGFEFFGYDDYEIQGETPLTEFDGKDGGMPSSSQYRPYELSLNFRYTGLNKQDRDLFIFKLKNKLRGRSSYYITHSKLPGIKYAVTGTPKITSTPITIRHLDIQITFTVFKGYSESMYDTSHIRNNDDTWQFESGLDFNDESLIYKHTTSGFKIYNGSADKIDPLLDHNLIIYINIDAPNGFILWNRTTNEQFVYRKPVESTQAFTIKGVHPLLDGQRVGHNSNWQWITLEKGYNDFQFLGDNISNINVEFVFNYIYG